MSGRLHRLANGVRVVCDPMADLETLSVSVVAGRGARTEGPEQSGWAHLLEHMVFKGAGRRTARDIVEVIEAAGGQINAATSYERTSFQVRALKGGLPLALEVLADLVLRPTIDPDELEREKQVIEQEIAEAADAPDDRVFDLAQASAFAHQPLGRPILGSAETIEGADPAALHAFRAGQYATDRLVVSAAGAVDEDELLALVERLFGQQPASAGPQSGSAAFTAGFAPEARKLEQAHTVFLLPGVGARALPGTGATTPISPSGCSPRRSAEACHRACSRKRASAWASPTPSTPMARAMRRPGWWGSTPARAPTAPCAPPRSRRGSWST